MVHRLGSLLLFVCLVTGGAFAQINSPGNRGGTIAKQTNQASAAPIRGILRKMSDDDMIVEADDKRIMTIALGITTKFYKAPGALIRSSDMQPGDHLNIDATQDDNGSYHAKNVTQVKPGTAEERAAASQPVETSPIAGVASAPAPPATPAPRDPNDPGPPRVRRGVPPHNSDTPLVARNDSLPPGRPSIHAEEVNGVTRSPDAPLADAGAAGDGGSTVRRSGPAVIP